MARYLTQQMVMSNMVAAFVRATEPFVQLGAIDVHVDAR